MFPRLVLKVYSLCENNHYKITRLKSDMSTLWKLANKLHCSLQFCGVSEYIKNLFNWSDEFNYIVCNMFLTV